MKAFKGEDGTIRLFRPELNAERLLRSCERLTLPSFDKGAFVELTKQLVSVDRAWVPAGRGYSLYIRPTVIATQASLGVGASNSALMFTLLNPVGPYFASGFKPISLLGETHYSRAWPGGAGFTKCGGNYAPTILPQASPNDVIED